MRSEEAAPERAADEGGGEDRSRQAADPQAGRGLFGGLLDRVRPRMPRLMREDLTKALLHQGGSGEDSFTPAERAMLNNILRLREVRVEDIMVPRADIQAVEITTTLGELMKQFEASGHSRMPVYGESLDDPRGMIHIRDVVGHITRVARPARNSNGNGQPAQEARAGLDLRQINLARRVQDLGIIRKVLFVPPSMLATDLMARMQATRTQMALVIDEYGGTDGLVSLEDIIEMVVGNIEDEHDDEAPMITERGDGIFYADARADLDEVKASSGRTSTSANTRTRRTRSAASCFPSSAACRRAARSCRLFRASSSRCWRPIRAGCGGSGSSASARARSAGASSRDWPTRPEPGAVWPPRRGGKAWRKPLAAIMEPVKRVYQQREAILPRAGICERSFPTRRAGPTESRSSTVWPAGSLLLEGLPRALLTIAAGAACTLALPPVNFPAAGFIGFPLLVWLLDGTGVARSPWRRLFSDFATGWLFGFGYFVAGLWWMGAAMLVDAAALRSSSPSPSSACRRCWRSISAWRRFWRAGSGATAPGGSWRWPARSRWPNICAASSSPAFPGTRSA